MTAARSGRGAARKLDEPRLWWRYAPTPKPIIEDDALSAQAKVVAAAVAWAIDLRASNVALEAEVSHRKLAALASVSERTVDNAVAELKTAGYLEVSVGLGRAPDRLRFGPRCRPTSP